VIGTVSRCLNAILKKFLGKRNKEREKREQRHLDVTDVSARHVTLSLATRRNCRVSPSGMKHKTLAKKKALLRRDGERQPGGGLYS